MSLIDWAVVAAYLLYVIWDGIRMTKHSGDAEGYFLASRSLPWWAVGLSVMATQLSAITLVGATGQAYTDGMRFVQFYFALPIAMVILCVTAVPLFYRARVYTAYEYLEKRFDLKTRTLTSFFFLASRALGTGVVIAAPSVILSIVLGWDVTKTIFVIGISTTVYTMIGGVQAVTWTDVKQMFVIFFGLSVVMVVIAFNFPQNVSFADGLHLAGAADKLTTIQTEFDISEKYTIWSGLFAALFLFLAYFGTDQTQVQRFLTAKSVSEGRTSLLMSAFLKIPMQFGILLIGVMVFIFYQFHTPPMVFNEVQAAKAKAAKPAEYEKIQGEFAQLHAERERAAVAYLEARKGGDSSLVEAARQSYVGTDREFNAKRKEATDLVKTANGDGSFNDVNYVFPTFVIQNMPIGVVGLIIAAIFAAAMSTISAELNALATATTIDFYKRHFNRNGTDREFVRFGRIATLFWGVLACVVAMYATNLGSLIEVVNKFGSFFYGSLLGVFVLAFGVRRARANGAFFGLLIGILVVFLVSTLKSGSSGLFFQIPYVNSSLEWASTCVSTTARLTVCDPKATTAIEFLWLNMVGCLTTAATGYIISLITREEKNATA